MATGIVSIAAHDAGRAGIANALGVLAAAVFAGLAVLLAGRLRCRLADPHDPTVVFGLYTFVAACGVLDARLGHRLLGLVVGLGVAQAVAWLALLPVVWTALRSTSLGWLRRRARGSWLLAAVGAQSLAITAVELSWAGATRPLLGAALVWWVLGLMMYLATATLIVWRALSTPVAPEEVSPDSWVLMGALAISALAGAELALAAGRAGVFPWLPAVMSPAAGAVWVLASAWIPLLVAGECWRLHRLGRAAVRYTRHRWAMVFPLGMYAAASYTLAQSLPGQHQLVTVSHMFFWVALLAWCAAASGLSHRGCQLCSSRRG